MYVGPDLTAHGTVSGTGAWAGYEYLPNPAGSRHLSRAPAGNYRLLVDGRVAVPFKLVASLQ